MAQILTWTLIARALRFTGPLLLAALGGLICERTGIINISLEGMMLFGAFSSAFFTIKYSILLGVMVPIVTGIVIALVLGIFHVKYAGNSVIAGLGIVFAAMGLTPYFNSLAFGNKGVSPTLQGLGNVAGLDPITIFAIIVAPILVYLLLFKTRIGVHLRATGRDPFLADRAGIAVFKLKYIALMLSGVLAALGGAGLVLGQVHRFTRGITAGRGFIAIAAYTFGRRHPFLTMGVCLLFGFLQSLAITLQGLGIPSQILMALPYIMTIIIIGVKSTKGEEPFHTEPYVRE